MRVPVKDNVIEIPGGRIISDALVGEPYFDDEGEERISVICTLHRPKRLIFVETEAVEFEEGLYARVDNKELLFVEEEGAFNAAKEFKNVRFFKLNEVD